MLRRAAEHDTTIYQMVRDPKLYDLPAYLAAADVALAKSESNLKTLDGLLARPGFWHPLLGCLRVGDGGQA